MTSLKCRVPPIEDLSMLTERQEKLRERLGRRGAAPKNIYRTMLRFPEIWAAMMPLGGRVADTSQISPRLREFIILRTAWRCDCEYEWAQHAEIARQAGLSDTEIEDIALFPSEGLLGATERMILKAVDELYDDALISDTSWTALADAFDEETIVDLIATCGFYNLLAWQLRSLGVQIEEGRAGYPARLQALKVR